ncbi:capsular polysaccharide export protein [Allofrancisella inopinata]|uniref:Capsule biosynthesis protein n=1 Tax=Allofrancisella inopinata TaxID=1085647 RepID=A0AAE6YIG2_9GAMM|nr:capsule biosynthesis protein [Allofrancisella inopinata]QIV96485.1 capsule biosynthesis protein [Allofrancisella inopinata]TDT66692.1 capsular polysaccharide export protein [Allofrancisella inopinata]
MDQENNTLQKLYLFGFSKWKHNFVRSFLKEYDPKQIFFINPLFFWTPHYRKAIKKGLDKDSQIFIWGRKEFPEVEEFVKVNNINITRVEDGFIRSINLGSNFTRPYSLVFDNVGIYFDATKPSRLENLLNSYDFDKRILHEAEQLRKKILDSKLSKYNKASHKKLELPSSRVKILVPGQVEDDASIRYGGNSMANLELLKQVRQNNPNAYILFKPHPDVISGNRIGKLSQKDALNYCDAVITNISVSSCLQEIDEVHTITSLVGFEGLLHGKKVVTYGMPFYAGWGITDDRISCERRKRKLTLEELVAGAYILYPKYLCPKTLDFCQPSVLIDELKKQREKLEQNKLLSFCKIKFYNYFAKLLHVLTIKTKVTRNRG